MVLNIERNLNGVVHLNNIKIIFSFETFVNFVLFYALHLLGRRVASQVCCQCPARRVFRQLSVP